VVQQKWSAYHGNSNEGIFVPSVFCQDKASKETKKDNGARNQGKCKGDCIYPDAIRRGLWEHGVEKAERHAAARTRRVVEVRKEQQTPNMSLFSDGQDSPTCKGRWKETGQPAEAGTGALK
jgi:hypothetical protein